MKNLSFFSGLLIVALLGGQVSLLRAQPAGLQPPALVNGFQRLTLRQGLAANFATGITQDKDGFIWISTVNGLTRFDGRNCRNFTRQAGDPRSLSHRVVRSVHTAKNGTLWVGTQLGLNRYDPATQTFQRFLLDKLPNDNSRYIRNIAETPDGQLWCGTKAGLLQFDPATEKANLIHIPTDSASQSGANNIRALLVDGSTLWLGTQAGLYAYNWHTKQFRAFRHQPKNPLSLPNDYVGALARNTRTGELIVGTQGGTVALLAPGASQFRLLPLRAATQTVASLLFTTTGELWVGYGTGGLHHYNPATHSFTTYVSDEANPRSLGCNCIKGLYEDRNGIVWIVTDDVGINWFNPTVEKFHLVFDEVGYKPASSQGLDADELSVDSKNNLWVATREGLLRVDANTQTHQLYRHNSTNANSLGRDLLYSVLADKQGFIWAGGEGGLSRFAPTRNRFEQIACFNSPEEVVGKQPNFVAGKQVFSMLQYPDGRIFIGTTEKLTVYDPQTGQFSNQFTDERIGKLPGRNYNHMHLDRAGNLWVGGLGPVYKISPDLRLLAQYAQQENDPNSLPDEGVTGFAEDKQGYIWMATDNGLARLNQRTRRFKTFTTRNGLPGNDIAAVLVVGDTLWVSTSQGLACAHTQKLQFIAFDEDDGLTPMEFESDAVARDSTGRIFFGAGRGLVSVKPHTMRLNRVVPPIFLTSFRVDGQEFLPGQITNPSPIQLDYSQHGFTFDMAALNYDNPSGNQFAYRLEGFEERWNQAGIQPFASYTNVPPGSYVLHVIGANNDGVWNREGYRLGVVIKPPFWQTWWFRVGLFALLLGLTIWIARWRERRLVQEQEEKSDLRERIAASEMKALRSQMNPHFLYNSLNAIRLFVLQNDSDNADKYLVKFSRLMRLILENSRQEWVSIADELEQLTLYLELEQLRFDNKFDFVVEAHPSIAKNAVSIPPMIIQPYIENSILHGMAHKKTPGHIWVLIKPLDNGLQCTIDDDGVGRKKAAELKSRTVASHKSMGLKVTEERLQLISQQSGQAGGVEVIDKTDEVGQSTGTTVVIQLPTLSD